MSLAKTGSIRRRTSVPERDDDWGAVRDFEELIHKAFYDYGIYYGSDYQITAEETFRHREDEDPVDGGRIKVILNTTFEVERTGTPGVDDFDNAVDEFRRDFDVNYNTAYGLVRRALIQEEYLPPGKFEKAVEKYYGDDFKGFKNLAVMYDEDDPGDGIDISLNIPRDKIMILPRKPGFYELGERKKSDSQGRNIYTTFARGMELNADNLSASLRRELRNLRTKASRQQTSRFSSVCQRVSTKAKRYAEDDALFFPFWVCYAGHSITDDFRVGFNIRFKLSPRTIDSVIFEHVEAFLDYLDEHIDVLYQAAEEIDDAVVSNSIKRAAAAREKLSGGLAGKLGEPQALEEDLEKNSVRSPSL